MTEPIGVGREIVRLSQRLIDLAAEYLRKTELEVANKMDVEFDDLTEQLVAMYRRSGFSVEQAEKIARERVAEIKAEYGNG